MPAERAVFLSYASQDAEAARRICEALHAAGVQAWLDQSELRGGDAWDAMIRKRIRECALFMPVISAATEARGEGYFRLEWKLAVDRSHLMADDAAFLMPVAIDDTDEQSARVPDRFREIQWTRVPAGCGAESLAHRVKRLLDGGTAPAVATTPHRESNPSAAPSIAVLPFANTSRDEDNEYFADGLADELMQLLCKIRGLRVASRTSAFFFKGKPADVRTIAQALGVATILEGSVRKAGARIRIAARLVEASTDSPLWAETYDRQLDDIFAVQDDIAQAVVAAVRAPLMGRPSVEAANAAKAEVELAGAGRSADPRAHEAYLRGRFFVERLNAADVARGVEYLKQAIAIDPGYALAWAALSRALWHQAGWAQVPPAEGFEAAREAAERALAIDPDLVEGHVCLAQVMCTYDWDWKGAESQCRRALALAPGNADAMRGVATVAAAFGRRDEAVALFEQANVLDPLSIWGRHFLALRLAFFGELERAEEVLRSAIDINPQAAVIHGLLSMVVLMRGDAATALEIARQESMPEFRAYAVAMAEHTLGHAAESDAALEQVIAAGAMDYQVARIVAWRGENERTWEWLERAIAERDSGLWHLRIDPVFEALRSDPRWEPLLAKVGLK